MIGNQGQQAGWAEASPRELGAVHLQSIFSQLIFSLEPCHRVFALARRAVNSARPVPFWLFLMAPMKDETVEALRDTIHQLESRVQQLEAKLSSTGGNVSSRGSRSNSDSVRMILMGPPGAGKEVWDTPKGLVADCVARQGYAGTKNKG